jgi:TonB-linked SusC/RagA family outer membrane protein
MNLQGANVYITELNVSVGSNQEGVYRIVLPADRVRGQTVQLRVRAIGFQQAAKPITLNAGTITENFELRIDINRLSEVVVTGVTGATETRKLAFTVDKVDQASLPVPATSALSSLAGKVTGAQVVMPSGKPGASPDIILRGAKSLNLSLDPLVIVDGVLLNGGLSDINPQDIESIEVVKGAAASSTYGSRAQNGVVQITTKSGKSATGQGARFNVRQESGFSDIQSEYPFSQRHWMTMDENYQNFCVTATGQPACSRVVNFEDEALRINQNGGDFALDPHTFERDAGIGTSLAKPLLKGMFQVTQWPVRYNPIAQSVESGLYSNTNLDMSGRAGNTDYFASASTFLQEGAFKFTDGYRRNTARLNVGQQIGEEVTVNLTSTYARTTDYDNTPDFFRLTRVPAGVDLLRRDNRGRLFIRSNPLDHGEQNENALYDAENQFARDEVDRYLGSLSGRYTPLPWLDLDANASMDRRRDSNTDLQEKGFRGTSSTSTAFLGSMGMGAGESQSYNFGFNATARQTNPFGIQELQTRLNLRYSFEREDNSSVSAGGDDLAVPGLVDLVNVTQPDQPGSSKSSERAMGVLGGVAAEYKGRYIFDATWRRDGSSLFGAAERWQPYYRGSLAWRLSDESFWPWKGAVNDMKLRGSVGTAGGRPNFNYQYETFDIGTGGALSSDQKGNRFLKPELTTEVELGFDAELLSKYGLNVTYARSITEDIMLLVPSSASSGFSNQWQNAGTIENRTWEVSLNVPLITNRDIVWTSRIGYDRNRAHLTELFVPEFSRTTDGSRFDFRPGERLGTIRGTYFLTNCGQLEEPFRSQCGGPGSQFQQNDEGFIVWTGGYLPSEGITRNLWQATLAGCVDAQGVALAPVQTGVLNCTLAGGIVNAPFGQPFMHWGQKIVFRDETATKVLQPLGNTSPDFHISMSHSFQWKRVNAYALVDGNYGNRLFNEEIHWSLGDFMVRYEDQDGKTVENAKPMGYYWRATSPDNGAGVGGTYDVLGVNNVTAQKGTYTKLREVSLGYQIGAIRGIGDWSITAVGRNLYTFTDFLGWDPETSGSVLGSSAFGNTAAFQFPQTRSFTITLTTRF